MRSRQSRPAIKVREIIEVHGPIGLVRVANPQGFRGLSFEDRFVIDDPSGILQVIEPKAGRGNALVSYHCNGSSSDCLYCGVIFLIRYDRLLRLKSRDESFKKAQEKRRRRIERILEKASYPSRRPSLFDLISSIEAVVVAGDLPSWMKRSRNGQADAPPAPTSTDTATASATATPPV